MSNFLSDLAKAFGNDLTSLNKGKPSVMTNLLKQRQWNTNLPGLGGVVSPLPEQANANISVPQQAYAQQPRKTVQGARTTAITPYMSPTRMPTQTAMSPTATPTPDPRSSWNNMANMIIREGNKRGYEGNTLARQMANESAYGTSNFAKTRYNYGGIGAYDNNPDAALKFKSPEDYLKYYFNMIQTKPRYADAYANRGDSTKYLQGLKKGGYASNPNYVQDVLSANPYQ